MYDRDYNILPDLLIQELLVSVKSNLLLSVVQNKIVCVLVNRKIYLVYIAY